MRYREYGRTGKMLSAIGFGGMRFERPDDMDASAELVAQAYAAGVNYFDTAPGYGKSEDIFGVAFKQMSKTRADKPFYVSTKSFGGTPSDVRRDLENSLRRMSLDHIDFLHSWCVLEYENYEQRRENGVFKEFEKLKQEGLIRHICVSTHMNGDDIAKMLNDYPFEGVLLGYSAMNFAYRDAGVQAAFDRKMGVAVMNPLGGGIIPKNPERFSFLKTQQGESVVEAALRFLLNDGRITLPLVGVANKAQLDEAVRAVDGFSHIPKEKLDSMRAALSSGMNSLCTNCGYCEGCPQDVPIQKLMDAYNHYILAGEKDSAMLDRLRWHWGIGTDSDELSLCSDCGRCEELCTQKLPITDRIKAIKRAARAARDAEEAKKK